MGNDSSRLKGLAVDKTAVEANDFWTLYNAEMPTTSNEEGRQLLSIFHSEQVVNGQLWVTKGPLDRAIKNLMIYRHPYILKYVTTWERGGQKHLATERVRPLADVLTTQNEIQVCLGLRTILCSLIFLVEKAMARHLNICTSSVYITDNGSWRLAGFEYVWKSKEVTKTLLDLANSHRYRTAIDIAEAKEYSIDTIEQYAYATLCEEILAKCTKNDTATPHVQDFHEYCITHLKHRNAQMRPKLSAVLLHPYFNHEFVLIHSFLFELPLKSLQEKQDFFTGLIDRLRYFNEDVVGAQLAADLLSRMVLLDPTAQLCVTPYVLKTKTDHSAALFSNQTYTRHVMPHIKKMFRLRDAQIRLILLEYFMEFVRLLTKEELEETILPHLLAGMNDTNDVLVAKTLRCLADLVPLLGAAIVIGGQRLRLFSDGRPQAAVPDSTSHWVEPRSITPVMGNSVSDYMVSGSPLPDNVDLSSSFNSLPQEVEAQEQLSEMPPRLSPDGGEDDKNAINTDSGGTVELLDNEAAIAAGAAIEVVMETVNAIASSEFDLISVAATTEINLNNVEDYEDEAWPDWETGELERLNSDSDSKENGDFHIITTVLPSTARLNIQTLTATSSSTVRTETSLTSDASFRADITQSNNVTSASSYFVKPTYSGTNNPVKIIDDLSTLDIIVQKTTTTLKVVGDEFDFFKDMEPVIKSSSINLLTEIPSTLTKNDDEEIHIDSSRFAAFDTHDDEYAALDHAPGVAGDGWGVYDDDDVVANVWKE